MGVASTFTALEGEAFFQGSAPDEVPTSTPTMTTNCCQFLQFPNSLLLHPYIKTMQWPCPKAVIVSGEVCMEGRGEGGRAARARPPAGPLVDSENMVGNGAKGDDYGYGN